MNIGRWRARKPREWASLLLLPALAMRLLVPEGFMPVASDGVAVTMQMCHGDAQSAAVIRLAGHGDAPGTPAARHDSPCVFAATATVAPFSISLVPIVAAAPRVAVPAVGAAVPAARLPHRPQSARAPPGIV